MERNWKLKKNESKYDNAKICDNTKVGDKTIITNDNIPTTPPTEQVGGNHYSKMKIEPIKFILANDIPFCEANVIKYICRYKEKNGIEDLLKAKQYIDFLINELKEKNKNTSGKDSENQ